MSEEKFIKIFINTIESEMTIVGNPPTEEELEEEIRDILLQLVRYFRSHEFKWGY